MTRRSGSLGGSALRAAAAAAAAGCCGCAAVGVDKHEIKVSGWPDMASKVPLSTGIISGSTIFASGMAGYDMKTMKLVPGGIQNETKQALSLIKQIVEAGGSDMAHVSDCHVYLKDIRDFSAMNEVYGDFFPKPRPTRVAFEVPSLAGPAAVEIQCFASLPAATRAEVVVPGWPDMTAKYPFSSAITAGHAIFVSGFPGVDMHAGKLVEGGVEAETKQSLANIREVLLAAGSDESHIVNCAVYLKDIADFAAVNGAYRAFFGKPFPARVAMQVGALAGGASVEIQCSAVLPEAGPPKQIVVPGWPDMSGKLPFSSGIAANGFLFASGLAGFDMQTMKLVPGGVQNQTRKTLESLQEVVRAGGASMDDVVACAVYLQDMKDFAAMNEVYKTFFTKPAPARVATQVAGLIAGASVEIQCTVAIEVFPPMDGSQVVIV
eukprot:CAMPEP_0203887276 /NCGR_PEP_ID=MMETSP0359-20131031/31002_1 /ASSEMBLY_ACC=CAM_ASM_000338 /TAXON_ID=268821 /ORGANISM="Scrippsiella Hangoei, Strain SHTV-5" /LENGTH=434 /DNA_ID=CAMNT_0050808259 /DNA_START=14 /DNA_END=1318 /DNA_ORIENTATION=-